MYTKIFYSIPTAQQSITVQVHSPNAATAYCIQYTYFEKKRGLFNIFKIILII